MCINCWLCRAWQHKKLSRYLTVMSHVRHAPLCWRDRLLQQLVTATRGEVTIDLQCSIHIINDFLVTTTSFRFHNSSSTPKNYMWRGKDDGRCTSKSTCITAERRNPFRQQGSSRSSSSFGGTMRELPTKIIQYLPASRSCFNDKFLSHSDFESIYSYSIEQTSQKSLRLQIHPSLTLFRSFQQLSGRISSISLEVRHSCHQTSPHIQYTRRPFAIRGPDQTVIWRRARY